MTQENEVMLKKALNAVDRDRTRQTLILAALMCVFFVVEWFWPGWPGRGHEPAADVRELLTHAVTLMLVTIVIGVATTAVLINKATRRILKAIELTAK